MAMSTAETPRPVSPDYSAIKARQQATWASGDFGIIGTTLQIVGEHLMETLDVRAGARVLDVAAGNGNCTLAAARRWCDVTSTDYVPSLLADGRRRAAAERLPVTFQEADAEALPFPDNSFDVVVSSFGVMFAPDHQTAARELLRVCRPQGRIGLANWTPDGFIGQVFRVMGKHVPPMPGLVSPARWGQAEYLDELFGDGASKIDVTPQMFAMRYRSPAHWMDIFRAWYGPVHKAFASLTEDKAAALEADLLALIASSNVSGDSTMIVPAEYVEVVVTKR